MLKKETLTHHLTLRLPEELYVVLRRTAFREKRSINDLILEALSDWARKEEKNEGSIG